MVTSFILIYVFGKGEADKIEPVSPAASSARFGQSGSRAPVSAVVSQADSQDSRLIKQSISDRSSNKSEKSLLRTF